MQGKMSLSPKFTNTAKWHGYTPRFDLKVQYEWWELLGFSESDVAMVEELVVKHLSCKEESRKIIICFKNTAKCTKSFSPRKAKQLVYFRNFRKELKASGINIKELSQNLAKTN